MNHIDSAPLRYAEAGDRWQRRYRNSLERWLKNAVRRDLHSWGFNSVGWTQEVVIIRPTIHRHSPAFSFEEYQWLGLPYCHLLPFAETHQWDAEVRYPDFFSRDFAEWCDYVARSQCARFAKDEKLIGYFYTDCPCWVHTRTHNQWKHPLFDPEKLKTEAGRKELAALATRYYQATHDAIRRHDQHHLILGDRYEAMAPVPDEVLLAARPFVDVFSFQHFGPVAKIRADLARWTGNIPAGRTSDALVCLTDCCRSSSRKPDTPRPRAVVPLPRLQCAAPAEPAQARAPGPDDCRPARTTHRR